MKYFVILNLIFCLIPALVKAEEKNYEIREVPVDTPQSTPDSELKKKFLKDTKIEVGEYTRTKKSDSKCLDGALTITDLGDELNLMLGARSLAGSIGRDKYEEKENECITTYETTFNDIAIKERVEQVCAKEKTTFHTTITLQKKKISYVKEAYVGDKLVDTLKCTIVKK